MVNAKTNSAYFISPAFIRLPEETGGIKYVRNKRAPKNNEISSNVKRSSLHFYFFSVFSISGPIFKIKLHFKFKFS